jgi:hypothetical protein
MRHWQQHAKSARLPSPSAATMTLTSARPAGAADSLDGVSLAALPARAKTCARRLERYESAGTSAAGSRGRKAILSQPPGFAKLPAFRATRRQ